VARQLAKYHKFALHFPYLANKKRKVVRTPVAVEKGTNTVISWDSPRFRERSLNHLRTHFCAISTQKWFFNSHA